MATEQEIKNAERLSNYLQTNGAITKQVFPSSRNSQTPGFTSNVMSIPASPEAESFNRTSGNFLFNKPATTPPPTPKSNSGGGSAGSGSSQGMTAEQALALAKFNYEKEKDANKLAGLQNYFDRRINTRSTNRIPYTIMKKNGQAKNVCENLHKNLTCR